MTMKLLNIAVLSLAFSALACGGGDDEEPSGPNACDYIRGNTYSSVDELPCGAFECRWQIYFEESGRYNWSYEDTQSSGDYTCAGLDIIRNNVVAGTLKLATETEPETVTWGEYDYQ